MAVLNYALYKSADLVAVLLGKTSWSCIVFWHFHQQVFV